MAQVCLEGSQNVISPRYWKRRRGGKFFVTNGIQIMYMCLHSYIRIRSFGNWETFSHHNFENIHILHTRYIHTYVRNVISISMSFNLLLQFLLCDLIKYLRYEIF